MSVAVPLSLAAVLVVALAVCAVALRRAAARAADAEARLGALVVRARAAGAALRDLRAMPVLDPPPASTVPPGAPVVPADPVRRVRAETADARRGPRRSPRATRPASDPSPPARS